MHNGGVAPFGYKIVDQKYVIEPMEAHYVSEMFSRILTGGNFGDLIEEMAAMNIIGHRGKPIRYPQIYEILHNEKYTGTYVYSLEEEEDRKNRRTKPNAIRIPNAIPAIVDQETFDKAQNIMATRKRSGQPKHPCSGLIYCSECGAKMHMSRTKRKGHEYNNFRCSAQCGAHGVPVASIDAAVEAYLELLFSEKNIEAVETALLNIDEYNNSLRVEFEKNRAEAIKKSEDELKNIIDGLASGAFKDNFDYCNSLITQKRAAIEAAKNAKPNIIQEKDIKAWIRGIIDSNYAPKIFIDRINANTTSIEILSNLTEVVSNFGCGGTIPSLPTTLFGFRKYM